MQISLIYSRKFFLSGHACLDYSNIISNVSERHMEGEKNILTQYTFLKRLNFDSNLAKLCHHVDQGKGNGIT